MQKTLVLERIKEGQVNRCLGQLLDASGKGINVTRVLGQLGADVTHLTQLGGFLKDEFLKKTTEDDLTVKWVPSNSEIRFCYTLINKTNRTTTEIVEEGAAVSENTEEKVLDSFSRFLEKTDTLIISGSKAKGFSSRIFPSMVKAAKKKGKFVILDYRGEDLLNSLPYQPDIIKPNMFEFMGTFFPDHTVKEEQQLSTFIPKIKDKMEELYKSYGTTTILTNGKQPTLFFNGSILNESKPAFVKAINTIGCGDAFTAGLAWKLSKKTTVKEAIDFAHSCGAKNAQLLRPGVIE